MLPWEEYEGQVKNVLESSGGRVNLRVGGKRTLKTGDAEYEVDAYAEIEVFGGAVLKVIIECKRYKNPVNRDLVMALHRKTQELGAHKAMLFATSSFQSGAVAYAKKHGIALVKLAKRRRTSFVAACTAPDDTAGESIAKYVTGTVTLPLTLTLIGGLLSMLEDPSEQEESPKFEPPVLALNDDSTYVGVLVSASDASMTIQDWLAAD
jgi:hypothetical protein